VIHGMNSEEWECGNDCLALICVFVRYYPMQAHQQDCLQHRTCGGLAPPLLQRGKIIKQENALDFNLCERTSRIACSIEPAEDLHRLCCEEARS
jgi:hypothetical protein